MNLKKNLISRARYKEKYFEVLDRSRAAYPEIWNRVFQRAILILECSCKRGLFCHTDLIVEYAMQYHYVVKGGYVIKK